MHAFQPGSGQFDWLTAVEDGLDDVGREKGERNCPANVCPIDALSLGQLGERVGLTIPEALSE